MEKKTTAVEWLYKISKERELDIFDLEKAMYLEKLQITTAYLTATEDYISHYNTAGKRQKMLEKTNKYYEDLYGK